MLILCKSPFGYYIVRIITLINITTIVIKRILKLSGNKFEKTIDFRTKRYKKYPAAKVQLKTEYFLYILTITDNNEMFQ